MYTYWLTATTTFTPNLRAFWMWRIRFSHPLYRLYTYRIQRKAKYISSQIHTLYYL